MIDLLEGLCGTCGPSGHEGSVREMITEKIKPYVDGVRTDALGNLVATMFLKGFLTGAANMKGKAAPGGKKGACQETAFDPMTPQTHKGDPNGVKRLMLVAHMDEVGLMVTHIDEDGFLRFAPIGPIEERFLPGRRVRFAGGAVGIIGIEPVEKADDVKFSRMFVDLGEKAVKPLSSRVNVGDVACFDTEFRLVSSSGESFTGKRVISKALDDRTGCVVLMESAKRLDELRKNGDGYREMEHGEPSREESLVISFVFTVQAQLGPRGAKTSAFALAPDEALVIDVTPARDTPGAAASGITSGVRLGAGPVIRVKDARFVSSPDVRKTLVDAAASANIPYQMEVLPADDSAPETGGMDAAAIQLIGEGVPTGVISIPARYMHTPSEMVDLDDIWKTVELTVRWILMRCAPGSLERS
ncbi:MAG TPA: M42 family metallopeptidase [Clostridia bacterium]|nr:M42 family metallopeptidase [Clostridia bacterium]